MVIIYFLLLHEKIFTVDATAMMILEMFQLFQGNGGEVQF
jgi:hypothetical protein